jgi:hypothetical protein
MTNSRKHPIQLSILGILLAAMLALPAIAQEAPTILVARISGAVEVAHAEATGGAWQAATTGMELGAGWRLRTGEAAKAQLVFPRDNVVILKADSVLYVDFLDAGGGAKLQADEGSLLIDLANMLAPGSEFELETPTALAVVRGTKFGAEDIDDEDVMFHGYRGQVEIFDSEELYDPVLLTEGFSVGVEAGMPPGDPTPSGSEAGDFVADAEDPEPFVEAENELAPLLAELAAILARLQQLDADLAELEAEWARYESRDSVGQLLMLYAQGVLPLAGQVDEEANAFDAATEDEDVAALGETADAIQLLLADLYARLDELAADAQPLIDDNQDLMDYLNGLIPSGDPALGLRWGMTDSDGDGLSDVDELTLGTDPMVNNAGEGFFDLLDPPDGEVFVYPDDEEIAFEFEPLEGDLVQGYDLLVEGDGLQWLRRNVGDVEDVTLAYLVGPGSVFAGLLATDNEITLNWKVLANLDLDLFFSRGAAQAGAGGLSVSSDTRQIVIEQTPVEPADLYLELATPDTVNAGDTIRVRCVIEDVAGMAGWEITVLYDPSVMEFDTGRKVGLLAGATLFFSDLMGGMVVVSGVIPAGSDTGVTGTGDLFELEFIATEEGLGTIEISDAALRNMADVEIPVELGDEVEVEIEANLATSETDWPNDDYRN